MSMTPAEIIAILESGDFDALLGEFESDCLECKSQPYRLQTDEQKLELAKDISALANASGGLILLGFATTTNPVYGDDQIDRVRTMQAGLINPDQYRQIISSWLYPPLDDVEIIVFPARQDEKRIVAAINVPAADNTRRPILIRRTLLNSQRRIELCFGYCERKQSRVIHYEVERLHALLRDGRNLSTDMRAGFDALQSMIESRLAEQPKQHESPSGIEERMDAAIKQLDLTAIFALIATPSYALDLKGLFQSRSHALVGLLDAPPEVREVGFDINAGGNSQIHGRLRRAQIEHSKLLEIHRDGVIIFIASSGTEGLCWGNRKRQERHGLINQLALIEMVYSFCIFCENAYRSELEDGDEFNLQLNIQQRDQFQHPFLLEPGPLKQFSGNIARESPSHSLSVKAQLIYGSQSPERWAIILLSEFYALFGYEEDLIPYTESSGEGLRINKARIERPSP
jgi:hypothetical protein